MRKISRILIALAACGLMLTSARAAFVITENPLGLDLRQAVSWGIPNWDWASDELETAYDNGQLNVSAEGVRGTTAPEKLVDGDGSLVGLILYDGFTATYAFKETYTGPRALGADLLYGHALRIGIDYTESWNDYNLAVYYQTTDEPGVFKTLFKVQDLESTAVNTPAVIYVVADAASAAVQNISLIAIKSWEVTQSTGGIAGGGMTELDVSLVPGSPTILAYSITNDMARLVIDAPLAGESYPKTVTDLVGGAWGSVAHSDDGVNPFYVTNLTYSTLEDGNTVIYLDAYAPQSFFGIGEAAAAVAGWPEVVSTINYSASTDNSQQPMLMYAAHAQEQRPLLVGLHTWSGTYDQAGEEVIYADWCIENDWNFIHPHFRGPNWTPEACGSELVVQDIIDAVEHMKRLHNVDPDRIYLVGASGGGHAALLMAGRAPELWAGVSAWVPISDIRAWWEQTRLSANPQYATHIEQAVGGRPDEDAAAALECVKRSPITYLDLAAGVNLDINGGITDGLVPFTHSLYAFNHVVPEPERIDPVFIEEFYANQALPAGTPPADPDPLYGTKQVVYRKVSENTRVTIFQGGHEIIHEAALNWLDQQRKGVPANWNVTVAP